MCVCVCVCVCEIHIKMAISYMLMFTRKNIIFSDETKYQRVSLTAVITKGRRNLEIGAKNTCDGVYRIGAKEGESVSLKIQVSIDKPACRFVGYKLTLEF